MPSAGGVITLRTDVNKVQLALETCSRFAPQSREHHVLLRSRSKDADTIPDRVDEPQNRPSGLFRIL